MKMLFLVLALMSFNAFANEDDRELILEKHTHSGYVPPEFAFQKDCAIFRNGDVEVTMVTGGVASGFTAHISSGKVWEIRSLIRIARHYGIVSGPVLCDGGTNIVTGHRLGVSVLIKELKDCESNKWRKGWAATRLKKIASDICQI